VISLSQGRYLHTVQHKHRINEYTDVNALSGIRTHDPSVRAGEDISYLRRATTVIGTFKVHRLIIPLLHSLFLDRMRQSAVTCMSDYRRVLDNWIY
jgi:hypothetical protein